MSLLVIALSLCEDPSLCMLGVSMLHKQDPGILSTDIESAPGKAFADCAAPCSCAANL